MDIIRKAQPALIWGLTLSLIFGGTVALSSLAAVAVDAALR
jgi:hypothetical protein